jgi:hypothetical protein
LKSGYSLNYNCKTNRHIWLVETQHMQQWQVGCNIILSLYAPRFWSREWCMKNGLISGGLNSSTSHTWVFYLNHQTTATRLGLILRPFKKISATATLHIPMHQKLFRNKSKKNFHSCSKDIYYVPDHVRVP